jgi:hypothetical protein
MAEQFNHVVRPVSADALKVLFVEENKNIGSKLYDLLCLPKHRHFRERLGQGRSLGIAPFRRRVADAVSWIALPGGLRPLPAIFW